MVPVWIVYATLASALAAGALSLITLVVVLTGRLAQDEIKEGLYSLDKAREADAKESKDLVVETQLMMLGSLTRRAWNRRKKLARRRRRAAEWRGVRRG